MNRRMLYSLPFSCSALNVMVKRIQHPETLLAASSTCCCVVVTDMPSALKMQTVN